MSNFIQMPKGVVKTNGGTKCDMLIGACACGAWHNKTELQNAFDSVKKVKVYKKALKEIVKYSKQNEPDYYHDGYYGGVAEAALKEGGVNCE